MNYIKGKKPVKADGSPLTADFVIDCENEPTIEFTLLNDAGEVVAPEAGTYTLTGATAFYGKQVIFIDEITVTDETKLTFQPDTYNADYIEHVTVDRKSAFVQIHKGGDGGGIVMFGKAVATPRLADPNDPPGPIADYPTTEEMTAAIAAAIEELTASDITTEARGEPETQEAFNAHVVSALGSYEDVLDYLINGGA